MGYEKGKAFCNKASNVGKNSKNYSTYYIDVDRDNQDDIDLLNLVRGATLLAHGYAVSQPAKSEAKANDIGREQLSILAHEYCMPDSDYNQGKIPNTILDARSPEYIQHNTKAFMDMCLSGSYNEEWIHISDIEQYAEDTKEYDDIQEPDKRFPFLYGKHADWK